ncbi:MAG: hypothetical protein D6767_01825 [Candidatus Hydrogenedentota bacterium]|nr:MAG: hypothetical protein D6767_01825 [Candidatus Hydrogenedentota bacterium]
MSPLRFKRFLLGILFGLSLEQFVVSFSKNVVGRYNFSFSPWYSVWKLLNPLREIEFIYWFIAFYFVFNLLRFYFASFWTEMSPRQSLLVIIPSILFAIFEVIIFGFMGVRIYSIESFLYLNIVLLVVDIMYIFMLPILPRAREQILRLLIARRQRRIDRAAQVLLDETKDEQVRRELESLCRRICTEINHLEQSTENIALNWGWQNTLELITFVLLLFCEDLRNSPTIYVFFLILTTLYVLDFLVNWEDWIKIFNLVFDNS